MLTDVTAQQHHFEQSLRAALHEQQIVRVVFTKADGTERVMLCTLDGAQIPAEFHPKGTGNPGPEGVQRVFDVEAQAWRSFKYDSVISWTQQ